MGSDFLNRKNKKIKIPERTGWTLLSRVVNAKSRESLSAAWITAGLEVKMSANVSWSCMMRAQKMSPIADEVITDTTVANFAPLPLPAPSSFATRTLALQKRSLVKELDQRFHFDPAEIRQRPCEICR